MSQIVKRITGFVLIMSLLLTVGCTGKKGEDKKISIATMTGITSSEIVEIAKEVLEKEGYEVNVELFTDNITPNTAVLEKSVDFNFFQHEPFLNAYNDENKTDLKQVGEPLYGGMLGVHSDKHDSLDDIKSGATIGIANDASNRTLHLEFLAELGLIEIEEGLNIVTLDDIIANPNDIEFVEMEDTYIIRALPDVDYGMCSQNGIVKAGRDPEDAIVTKNLMDGAVLVTIEENVDSQKSKDMYDALRSDEVREYLEENYKGVLEILF